MVKPPKIRHSKSRNEPVTIELEPGEVSRIDEAQAAAEASPEPADAQPAEAAAAETTAGAEPAASEAAVNETTPATEPEDNTSSWVRKRRRSRATRKSSRCRRKNAFAMLLAATPIPHRHSPRREPMRRHRPKARSGPPQHPSARAAACRPMAAGIIGGVITLLGAGALQFAGLLPSPGDDRHRAGRRRRGVGGAEGRARRAEAGCRCRQGGAGRRYGRAVAIGCRSQLRRAGRDVGAGPSEVRCRRVEERGRIRFGRRRRRGAGAQPQDRRAGGFGRGARPERAGRAARGARRHQPEDRRSQRCGFGCHRCGQGRRGPAGGARAERRRAFRPDRQAGGAAQGGAGDRGGGTEVGDRARRAVHAPRSRRSRRLRRMRRNCRRCATSPPRAWPAAPI